MTSMWVVSKLTGQVYKNGITILIDDSKQDFQDFLMAQKNGLVQYVEATPEEIAEANKPIVPETISAMRLKLQLFDMGITDDDIFEDIDSIPEFMFSTAEKEKSKIMYKTSTIFERTNDRLNFVAAMEGLSQEQVDLIFINGNL